MSDLLYKVFLENETGLVNEILCHLKNSTCRHYVEMEWDVLLRRVESLVAYFMVAVRETPDVFVKYVAELAEARIDEGFCLNEVQMALRALEEQAWLLTVQGVPAEGQIRSLARVTGTVGAAKDRLAEIYVQRLEQEREKAEEWRERYQELAARLAKVSS